MEAPETIEESEIHRGWLRIVRLAAGLHALARDGARPALIAAWPPDPVTDDRALHALVAATPRAEEATLPEWLERAPQTNGAALPRTARPSGSRTDRLTGRPSPGTASGAVRRRAESSVSKIEHRGRTSVSAEGERGRSPGRNRSMTG